MTTNKQALREAALEESRFRSEGSTSDYWAEIVTPEEVLALLDEREAAERRVANQADIIAKQEKWLKDVEATMISATDRAESAEKLAENLLCSLAMALRQYDDFGQIRLEVIEEAELEIQKAAAAGITTKGE